MLSPEGGSDGLLELIVWGQSGGYNGCDGLQGLNVWGQGSVSND